MSRSLFRQVTQIQPSDTFTDSLAAGSTLQSGSASIEGDLNSIRSQLNRVLSFTGGNWYDDITSVQSIGSAKQRAIAELNTDLDDLEEKRVLFRTHHLADITVPAAVAATGTLTNTGNFTDGDTVTTGTKTYTFQDTLTDVDGNVLIGASASDSLDNLIAAINLGAGAGTVYASSTTANTFVSAAAGAGDTMDATALTAGTAGNSIATTETSASASWGGATLSGGVDGNCVILGAGEFPTAQSSKAAIGAVTTEGNVVATASTFGNVGLDEVAGTSAILPKNLVLVRDGTTGDPILSSNRAIYGLIQSESSTDGSTISETTPNRVQISFVRINSTGDDLELCPSADISGQDINYSYVQRIALDNIPEDAFLAGSFIDQAGAVDVTLQNAIDNQGSAVTQTNDIDINIADGQTWSFNDPAGNPLINVVPTGGGDTVAINGDTFDVNSTTVDFAEGMTVDSGGTSIEVGVTAGTVGTTGSNDLRVNGAGELYLDDGNQTGSTWAQTDGIKLSETTTEWDDFETNFGEVSILNAFNQLYDEASAVRTKGVAVATSNVAADTNVTGAGGSPNIDAQLPDYSSVTFVSDVDVYLNGQLLRNGADAAANNDVYPGDTPANGDLKFEFAIKGTGSYPDVLTMVVWD